MKSQIKKISVLCFLLIGGMTGTISAQGQFKVGDVFPTIKLPSLADGHPASLQDYRGKKIILHVFASW